MRPSIRPVSIYRLVDPRDRRPRYVGKTENTLYRRLAGHLKQARDGIGPCRGWIGELLALGMRPSIELIETVPPGSAWPAREKYWILEYRRGCPDLLNVGPGGGGGGAIHMTAAVRARLSERAQEQWRMGGDEMRRRQTEIIRAYWADAGNREAQGQRLAAQRADPEKRQRLHNAHAEAVRAPAARAAAADRVKYRMLDNPGLRSVYAEATRRSFQDPARRVAHGKISALIQSKIAAKRLGISLDDYLDLLAARQKFCRACGVVHPFTEFGPHPRGVHGLDASCRDSRNTKLRAKRQQGGVVL